MTWLADGAQLTTLCDGGGIAEDPRYSFNSRAFEITGGPESPVFRDVATYPLLGKPEQGPRDRRFYGFGGVAVGERIYQFLSTFNRPFEPEDVSSPAEDNALFFNGVKLIYSPDNGRTWLNQDGSSPVQWEGWGRAEDERLLFSNESQQSFALLSALQMGKAYNKNTDGYIYIYAPNGIKPGSMDELVLARAPVDSVLDRASYQFYAGQGADQPIWSCEIDDRVPIHVFPSGWVGKFVHPYAWMPSVTYNPALNLFMMASWGMGCDPNGQWFSTPSYLGFWVSQAPWGPWAQIYQSESWLPDGDPLARCYLPQIAPAWISPDGLSFWLVWTDYKGEADFVRIWAEHQKEAVSGEQTKELVHLRRRYLPNYCFNMQKVELLI